MEPTNLKSLPPDDDRLEVWLRDEAALAPLPDDGFSARVVAALPVANTRSHHRVWLCAVGAATGVAFAAANGAFWPDWSAAIPQWEHALVPLAQLLSDPMLLLALVVAGISVLYALKPGTVRQFF